MIAVVYARYSSNLQRDASIEDQIQLCRERIEHEGWQYLHAYTDRAISGASALRPAYQSLLEDARRGQFGIVVAEALDRLSRDQEDVAGLFKRLCFAGVRLFTLSEGEISELHVGLKGTMNALFLKDLKVKVKRGLAGRVKQGKSAGGLAYGYRVVRELDEHGDLIRGGRRIDEAEALVLRRIFEMFAGGKSPRAIAKMLNAEGIPGPHARAWCDTMIRGHRLRGCGILHNEIYIGSLVWNRQTFIKDPINGRRVPRYNPETEWVRQEVAELRIVDQRLWESVRARLDAIYTSSSVTKARASEFWKYRRTKHLLTGSVYCAECGSPYSSAGRHYLACSAARRSGTCTSRRGIAREALENVVLEALKRHLLAPEYVEEFISAFHVELNRQRLDTEVTAGLKRKQLEEVNRRLNGLIEAIADGLRGPRLQAALDQLEDDRAALEKQLNATPPPLPRLHPRLAEIYRDKVATLHTALADPEERDEALQILRGLIERVVVSPSKNDRSFEIELVGEIANMVALLPGAETAEREPYRSSVKVVAGEGFEPPTLGL